MNSDSPIEAPPQPLTVPGKWVVIGVLLFGMLMAGGMWTYWKLNLAPFFPLQKALNEAFPKSSPRVDGGRHKNGPVILRIALHVDFRPEPTDPRVLAMIPKVVEIAKRQIKLESYEVLEVYVVSREAEQAPVRIKVELPVPELLKDPAAAIPKGKWTKI